ncbi:MAG: PAS domain S-box protein, partial [Planctomycetota bacterium]
RTREFEGQRKDGSRVPIEISVSRVAVPGQEQPLFTGIIHDITERKRAERAVQESERRFREILEEVDLVAVMLDTEGRVTFCNDHLLQLTGWTGAEALGQDWFATFLPPGHRARVHKVFEEGIKTGRIQAHYENEIVTRTGERRLMAWTNTIIRDLNGDVAGVTGLGVDVTEQRRAEAELARHREHLEEIVAERTSELEASQAQLRLTDRLASIGTLAAGLGHDMNNVLLPVRCRLDALAARELPREAAEHFEAVRKCVQYLQQLADGLHLLALDPEHTEPAGESTELSSWWEQVGSLLARGLPRHVRLATSWPSDLPPVAVAPHRLTQAVLNLLVNAGEAVGDDGKVRVSAETDGRTVRLAVTDNGVGMSKEVKRQALDPFFTTKKRGLGTGLGLSLVQGVARSARGSMRIDSAPGRGTTVLLELPAAARPTAPRTDAAGPQPAAVVSIGDPRLASFISALLQGAGFAVRRDGACVPGSSELWITEPSPEAMERARIYLREPKRQLLVLGAAAPEWAELGATVIDDPDNFETVRDRIRAAATGLIGTSS